jgi:hypothetical protein
MTFFYIEPEVAGGLGENTVLDRSTHPPIVSKLHYCFEGWLGDVLLESFPCFIVTEAAKRELQRLGVTGARFDAVEVTKSSEFDELNPGKQLPEFVWLRPEGKPGYDDVATADDGRLVLSARALELFRKLGIANALIDPVASI